MRTMIHSAQYRWISILFRVFTSIMKKRNISLWYFSLYKCNMINWGTEKSVNEKLNTFLFFFLNSTLFLSNVLLRLFKHSNFSENYPRKIMLHLQNISHRSHRVNCKYICIANTGRRWVMLQTAGNKLIAPHRHVELVAVDWWGIHRVK